MSARDQSANSQPLSSTEDAYLRVREMLLNGELASGRPLSQIQLAGELGVSATPLREAMRMLQVEGLLVGEHNRRFRVAPMDPADIEAVYAGRILTEALAVRLTVPRLQATDLDLLNEYMEAMADAARSRDLEKWDPAHREFHRRLIQGADQAMLRIIEPLMDRSERYRRIALAGAPPRMWRAGSDEHEAIVKACERGNADEASQLLARHLAQSGLAALADVAPEWDPAAVRIALRMAQATSY